MIISPGRNYIFVHVPKTGGTSLALALEGRAMADDILIGDTPKARRRRRRIERVQSAGRLWKHSTLADIDGLVDPGRIAAAFSFTLVRNPWDRIASYYHWLGGQRFDHPHVHLARSLDFSGFLKAPQVQDAMRAQPYSHYMTDSEGRERADLYIRLEHLDRDAEPLWSHLGFRLEVPSVNASARERDYRAYFTDDDAETWGKACAEDAARFGYAF